MSKPAGSPTSRLFTFRLTFEDDGAVEIITVKAESYEAALFMLPRFADEGRYELEPERKK